MPTYSVCPPADKEYCLNGGECFYLAEDPSVYICSCFMPFYGPQCEHKAPASGTTDPPSPKQISDLESNSKRSVDRAMTITALVFIVITFLGLLTLAWYLSSRRRKDYRRWCKMKGSPNSDPFQRQTMEREIQTSLFNLSDLVQNPGCLDQRNQRHSQLLTAENALSDQIESTVGAVQFQTAEDMLGSRMDDQVYVKSSDSKVEPELQTPSSPSASTSRDSCSAFAHDTRQSPVASNTMEEPTTTNAIDEIDLAFELARQAKDGTTGSKVVESKRPSNKLIKANGMVVTTETTEAIDTDSEKLDCTSNTQPVPDRIHPGGNTSTQSQDFSTYSPSRTDTYFHTLPRYNHPVQMQQTIVDTSSHSPYVNVRDIRQCIRHGQRWHSTLPKRTPCQSMAAAWNPVIPLNESHSSSRQPFVVASQHDALLQELFNRGSQDALSSQCASQRYPTR